MREALVAARDAGEKALDLDFGLGLYDYYADTLPRFFKVVAFVLRIPGGDRERGVRRARPRRARGQHLPRRRGARPDVRRPLLLREAARPRPALDPRDAAPPPGMADLGPEARAAARRADGPLGGERRRRAADPRDRGGAAATPTTSRSSRRWRARCSRRRSSATCASRRRARPRAGWARGRKARGGPASGRAACSRDAGRSSATRAPRRRAAWLSSPWPDACASGARSPRPRPRASRAFQANPASDEARLCAARESLRAGRPEAARALARAVLEGEEEPWLRPHARLALARALETAGARDGALAAYRARVGGPARASRPARRGGGGRRPPRPRRVAARGAGAGALSERRLSIQTSI